MPQPKQNKLYRTFVKGLVTEASPLTYPEDTSLDEDNCVLFRKGNRARRLGFDFEDNFAFLYDYVASTQLPTWTDVDEGATFSIFVWKAVANDSSLNFLCVQVGKRIFVYDMAIEPLSGDDAQIAIIDLLDHTAPSAIEVRNGLVGMASGKGVLFVAGEKINPFYVEYDPVTETFTEQEITIKIRDFVGRPLGSGFNDDPDDIDSHPTTLTDNHEYNLRNQGWIQNSSVLTTDGDPILRYFEVFGEYPSNAQIWWVGKVERDTEEDFKFVPARVEQFAFGNTRAPQGHYILDAFHKDRSNASGIGNFEVEEITDRPIAVAFFAGRAWWGLNSTLYFSQVFDDKSKLGRCYQAADPTAEDFSDLADTDGGTIEIPEIGKIVKLYPIGSGILVFGTNGIWNISGGTAGFTAKEFVVSKVSPIGTEAPESIVEAEGQIFWWSRTGIMGMTQNAGVFGPIEGSYEKTNISEKTIQSFYNDIPERAKVRVKSIYDPALNTIAWMYNDGSSDAIESTFLFNKILTLDLTLGAFYPWTVSSFGARSPAIVGAFASARMNAIVTTLGVDVGVDNVVVGADSVVVSQRETDIRSPATKYVVAVPDSVDQVYGITFGEFRNTNFADWEAWDTVDSVGVAYNSFLTTGFELLEDAMRKKQIIYLFTYFRQTEENFTTGISGDYEVDKPSHCDLQVRWEWSNSTTSGKWTTPIEAYRILRVPFVDPLDLTFDSGFSVVRNKHKIRGTGRSVQFKFQNNEIGSDFDLLGWAVAYSGNPVP